MQVIIVGAGFAGLKLARELNNREGISVLLLDRLNYHQFQPLFYQVATAGLDPSNISFPLRKVFQGSRNVRIRIASLLEINAPDRKIQSTAGEFSYDVLVLAMGATTNFFGNNGLASAAFPMKSTMEAVRLRHRLIEVFEQCVAEKDPENIKKLLTMVVVGGGPTGVEVSGALAEMKRFVLPKDYPEIDFGQMRIMLLEGADRLLAAMSPESSRQSKAYLEHLGVEVRLQTFVEDFDGSVLSIKSGEKIPTATLIWAAGIQGNIPAGIPAAAKKPGNRIQVDRNSQVADLPGVFVLGDLACMETPKYPKGHPQVANVAIHQALVLAKNLLSLRQNGTMPFAFDYADKGSMATVGRHLAVVDIPKPRLHMGGFFAWLIWMGLHLMLLLGVKNRIQVFVNWTYKYLTYDQSLRLLFREKPQT